MHWFRPAKRLGWSDGAGSTSVLDGHVPAKRARGLVENLPIFRTIVAESVPTE